MYLDEHLSRHNVWHRFIPKKETVHTADAAKVSCLDLHRITKNLVSITDKGEHVVLIVPGDRRVNLRRAAEALEVRNVRLLSFENAEAISGYPPGATPSIGFQSPMRVIVDSELTEHETLYCGGGTRDRLLEVRVEDVIRFNEAIVAPISKTN